MNGVQTRLKCKPNVKRCKRFVFAAHSPLLHPNTLKTKAIIHFQTDHILTRFVFPPLLALSIEAAELNQLFLWKSPEEANVEKIKEELADVLNYALLIANKYNFDVAQIILDKIEKNAQKYPVEKAKGTAKKYNEL